MLFNYVYNASLTSWAYPRFVFARDFSGRPSRHECKPKSVFAYQFQVKMLMRLFAQGVPKHKRDNRTRNYRRVEREPTSRISELSSTSWYSGYLDYQIMHFINLSIFECTSIFIFYLSSFHLPFVLSSSYSIIDSLECFND